MQAGQGLRKAKTCAGKCEGDDKHGGACEEYEPVLNSKGKDVVIGTAVFEGYLAGETSMTIPAAVSHLSDLVYAPSALQSVRATLPYIPCACLCCLCTVNSAWAPWFSISGLLLGKQGTLGEQTTLHTGALLGSIEDSRHARMCGRNICALCTQALGLSRSRCS